MSDAIWWLMWPVLIVFNGTIISAAFALTGKRSEAGVGCTTAVFSGTLQWGAMLAIVYGGGAMGVINGIGIFAISLIPYTMLLDTPQRSQRQQEASAPPPIPPNIAPPPTVSPTLGAVTREMEQMAQQPTPQPPPTTTMQPTTTTATPVHVSYDKRIERRFEALEFREEKDK